MMAKWEERNKNFNVCIYFLDRTQILEQYILVERHQYVYFFLSVKHNNNVLIFFHINNCKHKLMRSLMMV